MEDMAYALTASGAEGRGLRRCVFDLGLCVSLPGIPFLDDTWQRFTDRPIARLSPARMTAKRAEMEKPSRCAAPLERDDIDVLAARRAYDYIGTKFGLTMAECAKLFTMAYAEYSSIGYLLLLRFAFESQRGNVCYMPKMSEGFGDMLRWLQYHSAEILEMSEAFSAADGAWPDGEWEIMKRAMVGAQGPLLATGYSYAVGDELEESSDKADFGFWLREIWRGPAEFTVGFAHLLAVYSRSFGEERCFVQRHSHIKYSLTVAIWRRHGSRSGWSDRELGSWEHWETDLLRCYHEYTGSWDGAEEILEPRLKNKTRLQIYLRRAELEMLFGSASCWPKLGVMTSESGMPIIDVEDDED